MRPSTLFLASLSLGACAPAASAPPATTCDLVVIGTSLTAGYGLPHPARDAWGAGFETAIARPHTVHQLGIPGATAASWEPMLGERLRSLMPRPAWVIVELGANESLRGTPSARFAADLARLLDTITTTLPEARLALVRVPPGAAGLLGHRGREARAVAESVTARGQVAGWPVVPDLLAGVRFRAATNQGDGLHPNALGARQAFANAWETLSPWFHAGGCR
ncbi:MAG: GDSL-type esterase/lipase family protein [Gemmatimonadales bacterium]|nr:GDSL-type esterase/lipase family protein [Gemmatimonadales bacterium]MDZ4390405.1 GDSL-type esterase/lipase family protein [Gemmatimonadales bacterium]